MTQDITIVDGTIHIAYDGAPDPREDLTIHIATDCSPEEWPDSETEDAFAERYEELLCERFGHRVFAVRVARGSWVPGVWCCRDWGDIRRDDAEGLDDEIREVMDALYLRAAVETHHGFRVGDQVEGGDVGTEDHDTGEVIDVDGDSVTVAWDSLVQTTQGSDALRRAE